jgi:hypothetical protein
MKVNYTATFFIFFSLLVITTAAFNYAVDPLGLYRPVSTQTLSRIDQFLHMRTSKPLKVSQLEPANIIIGSSRSGRIEAQHALWTEASYNLSLPGATPYEILQLAKYSHRIRPIEQLIIGLDFNAFLSGLPKYRQGFNEELITQTPPSYWVYQLEAHRQTLISSKAINISIKAREKTQAVNISYLPDGSWHSKGSLFSGAPGFKLVSSRLMETHPNGSGQDIKLEDFIALVNFCYQNTISCSFLITPVHLFHLEIFEAMDLLDKWREWHDTIVQINVDLASEYQTEPYPIWGFNTSHNIIDEPIRASSQAKDNWFKDSIHFRPLFGAMMLDEIITGNPHYGVRLEQQSIANYLQQVDLLRDNFQKKNTEWIEKLKKRLHIAI